MIDVQLRDVEYVVVSTGGEQPAVPREVVAREQVQIIAVGGIELVHPVPPRSEPAGEGGLPIEAVERIDLGAQRCQVEVPAFVVEPGPCIQRLGTFPGGGERGLQGDQSGIRELTSRGTGGAEQTDCRQDRTTYEPTGARCMCFPCAHRMISRSAEWGL